ncbi:hypothetical protein ERC79_20995 [Rhodococcus sp. ABRD24]|nr:hypothetical protein ERC79_20995 [Rhodococcus sp. ABRD24]
MSLCAGQPDGLDFETRSTVEISDCMSMIEGKTASLLACACEIGATAAGADRATASLLAQFGRDIGIAYQLTDDILGIWGDSTVTPSPFSPTSTIGRSHRPLSSGYSARSSPRDAVANRPSAA